MSDTTAFTTPGNESSTPIGNPESCCQINHYRLTFLTNRLIRIEFAADQEFEDRCSLIVNNRNFEAVNFEQTLSDGEHHISTDTLTVVIKDSSARPTADNVSVFWKFHDSERSWYPGKTDESNLLGTYRTLDFCDGETQYHYPDGKDGKSNPLVLEPGLISRSGWSVIDDSTGIVIDPATGWVTTRPAGERLDCYLFAYDDDYTGALRAAASLVGRQPLPPRYALGYWWSRYWAYTDKELEQIVLDCNSHDIPLDVLVIDMDWHKQGWTGFSWETAYFPDSSEFLAWVKQQQLHVSMNLHPADGYGPHEDQYNALAKELQINPDEKQVVAFDCTSPENMQAYFKTVLAGYEQQGVEFWWLDWQQGTECAIPGLDPLTWLNQLHWRHLEDTYPERRPLSFSRYGGLGSGRYPVGFSGDTYVSWESLTLLPWFTATASNALYGYWSHDMGGFMGDDLGGELYSRWIQFGIFSPILRTHGHKQSSGDRRCWDLPYDYAAEVKRLLRLRYELIPYLYTEARKTVTSAVSVCHPLYYHYPAEEHAYDMRQQYCFGKSIIVAPVTQPTNKLGCASQSIWLPAGEWFDVERGGIEAGNQVIERQYLFNEIPYFVKAGSILPGQKDARRTLPGSYSRLLLSTYGIGSGSYTLYEDDGVSRDYLDNKCALLELTHTGSLERAEVTIEVSKANFDSFLWQREVHLRLYGRTPPASITVNGQALEWSYRLNNSTGWTYAGDKQCIMINAGTLDISKKVSIVITFHDNAVAQLFFPAITRRLLHAFEIARVTEHQFERDVAVAAQTGNRITRQPHLFALEISQLQQLVRDILANETGYRAEISASKRYTAKKVAAFELSFAIVKQTAEQLLDLTGA